MFPTILVPLDGSEHAAGVLTHVRRLLRREDAELRLLGVAVSMLEGRGDRPDDRPPEGERFVKLRVQDLERRLGETAAALAADGISASWEVQIGDPAAAILATVEHDSPALVAMATHGRSGLKRLIRGSVAERVLRACPAPLLLCHVDAAPGAQFRKILVPLDGSERSASILPLAIAFAQLHEAELILFRVGFVSHPDYAAAEVATILDEQALEASLEQAAERVRAAGVTVSTQVAFGGPAGEILAAAEADGVDLVAISTHGYSGVDRWLFGSVAENVLRHCTKPLLIKRTASPS